MIEPYLLNILCIIPILIILNFSFITSDYIRANIYVSLFTTFLVTLFYYVYTIPAIPKGVLDAITILLAVILFFSFVFFMITLSEKYPDESDLTFRRIMAVLLSISSTCLIIMYV